MRKTVHIKKLKRQALSMDRRNRKEGIAGVYIIQIIDNIAPPPPFLQNEIFSRQVQWKVLQFPLFPPLTPYVGVFSLKNHIFPPQPTDNSYSGADEIYTPLRDCIKKDKENQIENWSGYLGTMDIPVVGISAELAVLKRAGIWDVSTSGISTLSKPLLIFYSGLYILIFVLIFIYIMHHISFSDVDPCRPQP